MTLTVTFERDTIREQHIDGLLRADGVPDDLTIRRDRPDEIVAEATPESMRWVYDYLVDTQRYWRAEGEQWDADVAEEMERALYDQVGEEMADRQQRAMQRYLPATGIPPLRLADRSAPSFCPVKPPVLNGLTGSNLRFRNVAKQRPKP